MKVLVVDDEKNIRDSIQKLFSFEAIDTVTASDGLKGKDALMEQAFDAVVLDLRMPGMGGQELLEWIVSEGIRSPVIMISALGEVSDAVRALKSGAEDYLIKPFDPEELVMKVRSAALNRRRHDAMEADERTAKYASRLLGMSPSMQSLKLLIERIAATDSTVLITGESGTGKEVAAREIHAESKGSAEPFVAVNIGGIHEELIESELFGHERGAFTGADSRKPGLFELAGRGTIFLDEIGDMPAILQVKLLRVLQERKIRRLGGTRDLPVDARILSATNKDIDALVKEGKFREDLYYRLNVVRIEMPPLRERKEDIPLLARSILDKLAGRMGKPRKTLSDAALEKLDSYSFPGNIRELENILERAMIYCESDRIDVPDLDIALPGKGLDSGPGPAGADTRPLAEPSAQRRDESRGTSIDIERMELDAIRRALENNAGNRSAAAIELGISRRTIQYKIKRFGL